MTNTNLFTELTVGPYKLPNRIIMAPMTRNRAGDGNVPRDLNATYYQQRASAGLIITEATQISHQGQGYPNTPGIYSEDQLAGWRKVTTAVHQHGGHIFAQLWHTGRTSHSFYQPGNSLPVAPSAIPMTSPVYVPGQGMVPHETPRALDLHEIPALIADYARAAKNAIRAGFDGVEIHAANGYLIDQFLRDGTNHRTDRYGGSVANRTRFAVEIATAVTDAIGPEHVGIRLSPSSTFNDMADSTPRETFGQVTEQLDRLHLAYLHVIAPTPKDAKHGGASHDLIPVSFFRPIFKNTLIANGGYTLDSAQSAIADGFTDAVAFGTSFLANPDLPHRLRTSSPLTPADPTTFYGGDERGYTDYPALSA
ncbi:MAG TPA: alkene reductase [Tepidisphaeraceae bacterium]|nr:alkene reductase [Tepidisphaeraceae bacterium]